jgi:AmmeMemoRadiSam system protein A
MLTPAERRELLRLARDSIRAALRATQPPAAASLTPALCEPAAVFVSLHQQHRLRGCVGTLSADRPLHEAVVRTARSAALDDPRFAPLAEDELADVRIEISRLGPMVPVRPEQVHPGSHGVCLRRGDQHAVFLPQVATRHDWNRETLLSELCLKALLPPDTWTHPDTSLMVFSAEVFADDCEDT